MLLPRQWPLRAVLAAWLLFVLNVNVALKGLLTAESAAGPVVHRLASVADLVASDLVLGYTSRTYTDSVAALGLGPNRTQPCYGGNNSAACMHRCATRQHV